MTTEAKRIAIAKACGWAHADVEPFAHPDYLNDLNAMHEAEKVAIRGHRDMEYRETLERVCNEGYAAIVHATAAQRAEAFGRTLNLWTE